MNGWLTRLLCLLAMVAALAAPANVQAIMACVDGTPCVIAKAQPRDCCGPTCHDIPSTPDESSCTITSRPELPLVVSRVSTFAPVPALLPAFLGAIIIDVPALSAAQLPLTSELPLDQPDPKQGHAARAPPARTV